MRSMAIHWWRAGHLSALIRLRYWNYVKNLPTLAMETRVIPANVQVMTNANARELDANATRAILRANAMTSANATLVLTLIAIDITNANARE